MPRRGEGFWTSREAALGAEWLETNALGGYASSTLLGANTRRYHGLLVAATRPPVGRAVLLSKLEETLVVGTERFDLSINAYVGATHPEGDRHLVEFRSDPFPTWIFEAGGVRLSKTLFLVDGENTVVVRYRVEERPDEAAVRLDVRPLTAFRDYHALTVENGALRRALDVAEKRVIFRPYEGQPALAFAHDAAELDGTGYWYRGFVYERERERGFDFTEDLFSPFRLVFDLTEAGDARLVASTEARDVADVPALEATEKARRAAIAGGEETPLARRAVKKAASQFVVRRGGGYTVIAGYPWFTDWGRDTMIALPGLALATGRHDVARSVLATFARHVDGGMIPNRFPDAGEEPEFNTVDATLWLFEALRAYHAATDDGALVRELHPTLVAIVDAHERGTRYGIHVDGDGLLASGAEGVQLTWMDAKVGDWVVTPRRGRPVEIQALWFNALSILARFSEVVGDAAGCARFASLAARAKAGFERLFWSEETGGLVDVLGEDGVPDASVRPNQLFAVSLPFPLLEGARARRVVERVERDLLTPYGLRTLAPSDPRYVGRYAGSPAERDGAYHQGTVWPWLLGPFVAAYLRVHGGSDAARMRAAAFLKPLFTHLLGAGLGQLPEVFDGDRPHRAGGCVAQAWSVAQLIEALDATGLSP